MHFYDIGVPTNIPSQDGRYTYSSDIEYQIGQFVEVPFGKKKLSGVVLAKSKKPSFATRPVTGSISENAWPSQLASLAEFMATEYAAPTSTALKIMLPAKLHQKRLASRKAAKKAINERRDLTATEPTKDQRLVIDQIKLDEGYKPHLLHGETGSGKTLVYKKLIDKCLALGRQALVIVPEISLTPQLEADLRSGLENVLVLHSTLTESAKYQAWRKALELGGEPCLVVGTRSALFAPLHNIGLIVIDECHDESLNQTGALPYSGTVVAASLAKLHNSPLILGSATPKIADYYTFSNNNFALFEMPVIDASAREQTPITVVDMSKNDAKHHQYNWLSKKLFQKLTTVVESGGQAMIFLNRRGTARVVSCENCGWTKLCPDCEVAMIYHHDLGKMICHSCSRSEPLAPSCPECGEADISLKSHGTKRLVSDLTKLYPSAKIARIDSDSSESESLSSVYQDLHDGKYNIIVGTQIITKGLDLPKLELVGIVSADSNTFLPDYRANELMFAQLHQVVGRVGRSKPGEVYIQTYHSDSPVMEAIKGRDYKGFYSPEINLRKEHNNPPFTNLMRIVISDKDQNSVVRIADHIYAFLAKKSPAGLEFHQPTPCFYEKLSGKYRWQILLKSSSKNQLRQAKLAIECLKQKGVSIELFNIGVG